MPCTVKHPPSGCSSCREEQFEQAFRDIRPLAEAWADPNAGGEILAILDRLT